MHKSGISVINVHGTSFERYIKLFSRSEHWIEELNYPKLNIPISIVTDIDVKPYIYYEKEGFKSIYSIQNNIHLQEILKIIDKKEEDLNTEFIGKEYSTLKKLAKDFKFEVNNENENELVHALKLDISEKYIEESKDKKLQDIEEKYCKLSFYLRIKSLLFCKFLRDVLLPFSERVC